MKKNLLSILILALLIVNVVLTAIMMFSVTSASNKTAALVTDIASIIKLDVGETVQGEAAAEKVPIANTIVFDIPDKMTIPLLKGEDGKDHFAMMGVSLSLNTKADGYKEYGEGIAEKVSLIQGAINEVVTTYTADEARNEQEAMRQEILAKVQGIFESQFIFDVSFREILIQ
ncbi:MAG: flagellar basal body-associated FliL family protein [Lachnospiraceae bacterium]